MSETERYLRVGIVDFNTRRMSDEETSNIPINLQPFVAEKRQYPMKIGDFIPEGVLWIQEGQPWYFREQISDPEKLQRLRDQELLILTGSGMSAYKFQEGQEPADPPEKGDRELLETTEQLIRDHLGKGRWVLGDCFGGQLGIHALGGKVGCLPLNQYGNPVTEAGYLEHELTEAGRQDEVFGGLPDKYFAAHFHNNFVSELPRVGTKVKTSSGEIVVTKTDVLAVRNGYLDRDGLKDSDTSYIHAAVIEFDNGAKFYHTQPHVEMSTEQRANFFPRLVFEWLSREEQMGEEYAKQALVIPDEADFSASMVITNFVEAYKKYINMEFVEAVAPAILHELQKYRIE